MLADGLSGVLFAASFVLGVLCLLIAIAVEIPVFAIVGRRWAWRLPFAVVFANLVSTLLALLPGLRRPVMEGPWVDADPWAVAQMLWVPSIVLALGPRAGQLGHPGHGPPDGGATLLGREGRPLSVAMPRSRHSVGVRPGPVSLRWLDNGHGPGPPESRTPGAG